MSNCVEIGLGNQAEKRRKTPVIWSVRCLPPIQTTAQQRNIDFLIIHTAVDTLCVFILCGWRAWKGRRVFIHSAIAIYIGSIHSPPPPLMNTVAAVVTIPHPSITVFN